MQQNQFHFDLIQLTPSELSKLNIWYNVPFNVNLLMDALPHGSGIDCQWHAVVNKQVLQLYNAYHFMDEMGGYDGWGDFCLTYHGLIDFDLYMNTLRVDHLKFTQHPYPLYSFEWVRLSSYHRKKYSSQTAEYLNEIIGYSLEEFFKPATSLIIGSETHPHRRESVFIVNNTVELDDLDGHSHCFTLVNKPLDIVSLLPHELIQHITIVDTLLVEDEDDHNQIVR